MAAIAYLTRRSSNGGLNFAAIQAALTFAFLGKIGMYPTFLLNQQNTFSQHQVFSRVSRKRKTRPHISLKRAATLFLAGSVLLLFANYLYITNSIVGDIFSKSEYSNKLSGLEEQNRFLEIELARLTSYSNLREASTGLNMVEAGELRYLEIVEDAFARVGIQ